MGRGGPGFWALSGQPFCLELLPPSGKRSGSSPGRDLGTAQAVVVGGSSLCPTPSAAPGARWASRPWWGAGLCLLIASPLRICRESQE